LNVEEFLWLPDVADKLAYKHRLSQNEVEDVFFDRPHYRFVEKGYREGEDVYAALGQTDGGRYVIVYFILKTPGIALIVTARDMERTERRAYERAS
jgi:uncharacterized protein